MLGIRSKLPVHETNFLGLTLEKAKTKTVEAIIALAFLVKSFPDCLIEYDYIIYTPM